MPPDPDFSHLDALSKPELEHRRTELIGGATTYDELDNAALLELSHVLRRLRAASGGPPRASKKKVYADVSDLAV